jgi:hypothetical protein
MGDGIGLKSPISPIFAYISVNLASGWFYSYSQMAFAGGTAIAADLSIFISNVRKEKVYAFCANETVC